MEEIPQVVPKRVMLAGVVPQEKPVLTGFVLTEIVSSKIFVVELLVIVTMIFVKMLLIVRNPASHQTKILIGPVMNLDIAKKYMIVAFRQGFYVVMEDRKEAPVILARYSSALRALNPDALFVLILVRFWIMEGAPMVISISTAVVARQHRY